MSVLRAAGASACLGLLSGAASAFQPLVTDDTGTQGARGNQVEVAFDRTVARAPDARQKLNELTLVLTRGITETLDLYVAGNGQERVPDGLPATGGWGGAVIGAKWRFSDDEASGLSLGLKPEARMPVSGEREARGLGTARTSYGVALLLTQQTGFGAVHANAALSRDRRGDPEIDAVERRTLWRLSIAPVWDVGERWKLALDGGAATNSSRAARRLMGYVEAGAIFLPNKDLELAVGIVRDVRDGPVRTTRATVGVTGRVR